MLTINRLNLLGLVLCASTSLAHFTLDFPTSRGFDEDKEPGFCGGFTQPSAERTPFPLSSGALWIDSHHPAATVDAFLSVSNNPTSFDDFNSTSNGTSIPMVTNFFQVKAAGEYCWNVNLEGLGIGLTNGSLVTIQVQFNGGDGNLYQCADLILLSDYTLPSNLTCPTDATQNPTGTVSFAGAAGSTSSSGGQDNASSSSASQTSSPTSASSAAAHSSGAATSGKQSASLGMVGFLATLAGFAFV
ncbi:hypothetical protein DB88DRAFT_504185 [Papiliotrema laurentii]|uniref:Copper acquisition factor BIM1-like domain-containing protein n=1 Tax=Papiliotrema laurentii TaxID=5418 RepID=A0AAD9L8B3_PAPLA|nr:hypothetical protein DB88DRAFT_504185 [Papiliotrema laurentii]